MARWAFPPLLWPQQAQITMQTASRNMVSSTTPTNYVSWLFTVTILFILMKYSFDLNLICLAPIETVVHLLYEGIHWGVASASFHQNFARA